VFDLVSAQLPADSGKVVLHGEDISELAAHQRAAKGLGRSFQAARLWPGLTLEETVSLAVTAHIHTPGVLQTLFCLPTTGRAERKVRKIAGDVIDLLGLGDFTDLLISDLSTGTRRLAELAVIVAMQPSVVLLDEPSAGIAQAESEQLIPVLQATKEHLGCSMMIVEHDMTVMKGLADRIVALDTGRVVVVGLPDEVLSHPLVVESYLGRAAATI
jgi:ABC-type branched-subunit amino acid transport system ATPase component